MSVMQGSSSLSASASLRLDVKSLQLLLEPVMPQETTQEEEKPRHEKETETRQVMPQDPTQEKEKSLHEIEGAGNQEIERDDTFLNEESPAEHESRHEIGEKISETEQQKPDLT